MPFPQFEGKDRLRAIVPVQAKTPHPLNPTAAVLCYPRWLFRELSQRDDATQYQWSNRGEVYCLGATSDAVAVVGGLAVGAPSAVMLMEDLGAQGVRDFVIIGAAGGLQSTQAAGDVVLCDQALRDEGTSHHYLPPGRWARPAQALTNELHDQIRDVLDLSRGPTWTTDAPYRETLEELRAYRSEGILTVEMEAAGLFAAAEVRGYSAAASFVVADQLTDSGWCGSIESHKVRPQLAAIMQAAITTLHRRQGVR
ncbi:nucleoside phosphorylase [Brachybacterium tyrofermentans]|uniref:nucleoside phosphorylase n=1 Tax=Brachybacterium tyrofermentans TaxID=47848 RepID=UPI003FD58121